MTSKSKERDKDESERGIALSNWKCVVCGWASVNNKGHTLLQGAHVQPFADDKSVDKADNIIALCPNHHAEFDGYVFAIDPDTRKIVCVDPNNPLQGLSVEENIRHIKKKHLISRMYKFKEENHIN